MPVNRNVVSEPPIVVSKLPKFRNFLSRSLKTRGLGFYARYLAFSLSFRVRSFFMKRKDEKNVKVLLISLPKHGAGYPPSGIAYLKSNLIHAGFSCKCIDFNNKLYKLLKNEEPFLFDKRSIPIFSNEKKFKEYCSKGLDKIMNSWVEEILEINPKYLGISVTSYVTHPVIRYLTQKIRERNDKMKIIVGGQICKEDGSYFIEKRNADFSLLGRGESTFVELISALEEGKTHIDISGLIYKKKDELIFNQLRPEETLDDVRFPNYDDFDLTSYSEKSLLNPACILPITASIGCTRSCTFCTYSTFSKSFVVRDPVDVFNEMKFLKYRYGVTRFQFMDSMINADLDFLNKLCDLIIADKQSFHWSSQLGFKEDMDKGLIKKMSKAGCIGVDIGLESGSEKIRKDILKPCSNKKIVETLKDLNDAGINNICLLLIVGYPTETRKDFDETMEFVAKNKKYINRVIFNVCTIIPGTILSKIAKRDNIAFDDTSDWSSWSFNDNTPAEREKRLKYAIGTAKGMT